MKAVLPLLGTTRLSLLDVETLDTFDAELRRCRIHCQGRENNFGRSPAQTIGPSAASSAPPNGIVTTVRRTR
ncbi:hypothetical protein AB0E63_44820 [Kribbella sp. NPDC026596]|uniref:hypothetical protein n=1 Tax=Kribbella sp. NPDC026596 TaxID=3155122 RepID=UPI0033E6BA25